MIWNSGVGEPCSRIRRIIRGIPVPIRLTNPSLARKVTMIGLRSTRRLDVVVAYLIHTLHQTIWISYTGSPSVFSHTQDQPSTISLPLLPLECKVSDFAASSETTHSGQADGDAISSRSECVYTSIR